MADENILTAAEAAAVLRTVDTDPAMLLLLPQIDAYIETATGRDWTLDDPIHETAKAAARMLLVRWFEDPGGMGQNQGLLPQGCSAVLGQLEAVALAIAEAEEKAAEDEEPGETPEEEAREEQQEAWEAREDLRRSRE
jgi:hypothetical protein